MAVKKQIPVLDVRNSPEEREKIEKSIKANNKMKGSKYIKPSFSVLGHSYNDSFKSKQ